jgi:hypothetical protein
MSEASDTWAALPTETDIYILPNGEVVVADLPAELAGALAALSALLGQQEANPDASGDANQALDSNPRLK